MIDEKSSRVADRRGNKIMPNIPTLAALADDLENGRTNARKLVDECLARIADTSGEGAQGLHSCRRGSRDRGGGGDGPAARGQGGAVALCRHSRLDQGSVRHQGAGDPRRLPRAGGFSSGGSRCDGGGAAAPCRFHRDRPHQHDRIRLFRNRHQSALRHAEKHLAAQRRPCARRIVLGRGGVRRRRHGAWRARHRHRRVVPDSGGL